jgi:hypothetical protein
VGFPSPWYCFLLSLPSPSSCGIDWRNYNESNPLSILQHLATRNKHSSLHSTVLSPTPFGFQQPQSPPPSVCVCVSLSLSVCLCLCKLCRTRTQQENLQQVFCNRITISFKETTRTCEHFQILGTNSSFVCLVNLSSLSLLLPILLGGLIQFAL